MSWSRRGPRACPDAVAVVCGGVSLTYGGLEERADRLAQLPAGAGVGAETVVGLCLERGLDMVVAMLAVWKAGGAYLPLDPGYPAERLAFMLADSGARVLVGAAGGGGVAEAAAEAAARWCGWMTRRCAAVAAAPGRAAGRVGGGGGQLAYVIYTSGSTGRRRGCWSRTAGW